MKNFDVFMFTDSSQFTYVYCVAFTPNYRFLEHIKTERIIEFSTLVDNGHDSVGVVQPHKITCVRVGCSQAGGDVDPLIVEV